MRRRASAAVLVAALFAACDAREDGADAAAGPSVEEARYVGGAACAACHSEQTASWRGSHHDLAMQPADSSTVLGDFDGGEFRAGGVTSTFARSSGAFEVSTDGVDGTLATFAVSHTFGVEPLQQYLVRFPGGRYQPLSLAWDSRPAGVGGRWFHLHADDDAPAAAADPALHWTQRAQNWNAVCAECHSTNLDKSYDVATDTYATTWTDMDVGCEACHGPGSLHVANPTGVALALARDARTWLFAPDATIAVRVPAQASVAELETCAQCHSRRAQHGEDFRPGASLLVDTFRPALLERDLYHADGQILAEVYEYGSFVQSRMHAAGVTCSDCHEPHGATLRATGDALCAQCHSPARFATAAHHRHSEGSAGAQCVACHMPATTYMVVDPRRDHSFRVPRPDLTVTIETPNACTACHADRTAEWASAAVAEWYPNGRGASFHYGQAIAAARSWAADRTSLLQRVVMDAATPAIVRATGIELLAEQLDEPAIALLRQLLEGSAEREPLVALAAVEALAGAPPSIAMASLQRFLSSPSRAMRMAAARALIPARAQLSDRRRADLDLALAEYRAAQTFNMDRGEGWVNWGAALVALGRTAEAEQAFRAAVARDPGFAPAYVNLADALQRRGVEPDAETLLREALARDAEEPTLHFALALSLVRSGNLDAAIEELRRTVALAPDVPRFAYTLGVALRSSADPERGLELLRATHERFPGHAPTLLALATMSRDEGRIPAATEYARRLVDVSPGDPGAILLLRELEARR
jgi:predicted CXXCH cytochrome family protein